MEQVVKKINVLITDDHPLYRKAVRRLLINIPFVASVSEAENGKDALDKMEKEHFDVVLLDLMMPVMNGEEAAAVIRKRFPETRIIVVTMSDSKAQMITLLEMGVLGYVLKSTDESELTEAIMNVSQGIPYLADDVKHVWNEFLDDKSQKELIKRSSADQVELSEREMDIMRMLCRQFSTKEIADALSISIHTVSTHRQRIMKKLDTDNVVGIAIYAVKYGIYIP